LIALLAVDSFRAVRRIGGLERFSALGAGTWKKFARVAEIGALIVAFVGVETGNREIVFTVKLQFLRSDFEKTF